MPERRPHQATADPAPAERGSASQSPTDQLSSNALSPNPASPDPASASRVLRGAGTGAWEGLAAQPYKRDDGSWSGVTRTLLAGGAGSACAFELRYFELAPGGRSAHERHRHQHAVLVLRGAGQVRLGSEVHEVRTGDLVRVAAGDPHQFLNLGGGGPMGMLCVVDAERDAPTPLDESGAPSCSVERA